MANGYPRESCWRLFSLKVNERGLWILVSALLFPIRRCACLIKYLGSRSRRRTQKGGVVTLQALGRANALVWLTVIPRDDAPPFRTVQRHSGSDFTTLASCVQHELDGVVSLPVM